MADDAPLVFRRSMAGLEPINAAARDGLLRFRPGDTVRVRISKPRIHAHLAKYWLLMETCAETIGPDVTAEMLSDTVKVRTGHVNIIHTARGEIRTPKSIAFDKMTQPEFSAFYSRAEAILLRDFLPGVKQPELAERLRDLLVAA